MDFDSLIPPVLQPYKAWIFLAWAINAMVVRPCLPVPKAASPSWYVFLFNVSDKLSGAYGTASHIQANIPQQKESPSDKP